MPDIDTLEVPEGHVILVKGVGGLEETDFLAEDLHERFPKSIVIFFSGDETFETVSPDILQALLEDLLEHRKAAGV